MPLYCGLNKCDAVEFKACLTRHPPFLCLQVSAMCQIEVLLITFWKDVKPLDQNAGCALHDAIPMAEDNFWKVWLQKWFKALP